MSSSYQRRKVNQLSPREVTQDVEAIWQALLLLVTGLFPDASTSCVRITFIDNASPGLSKLYHKICDTRVREAEGLSSAPNIFNTMLGLFGAAIYNEVFEHSWDWQVRILGESAGYLEAVVVRHGEKTPCICCVREDGTSLTEGRLGLARLLEEHAMGTGLQQLLSGWYAPEPCCFNGVRLFRDCLASNHIFSTFRSTWRHGLADVARPSNSGISKSAGIKV